VTARVLVVDDIPVNRQLLEAKLLAEYYEVAQAGSGHEALDAARAWQPDVVLLDVMMPGMDGYEVCARLKADPATAHLPVVMVTALVDATERVRGLDAGADDFLSKPVHDATLFARLRALLRIKQVQDAWRLRADTARALGFEPPQEPEMGCAGARAVVLAADLVEARWIASVLAADGIQTRCDAPCEGTAAAIADGAYDLAVLCLSTAGSETLRLASRLRAASLTRDLPVLLAADPSQRDLVLRGFELGANDHVLRPIDPHELRARARNQIRRKRYQERLRDDLDRSLEMAVTDPLTGLRNRRYLRRHLDTLLRNSAAAVLLVDLDHFKAINDRHGHAAGDAALRHVAERLSTDLRAADIVARYGGEEFVVVLANAPASYATGVAERLRRALHDSGASAFGLAEGSITASIGVAVVEAGTPASVALEAADLALYRAKSAGRDRVEIAGPNDYRASLAMLPLVGTGIAIGQD